MPEGALREYWSSLPDSGLFAAGDSVYSLCHNCNNIIGEMHPGVQRNPRLAPKHYVEGAVGKFIPHSPEEQEEIMRKYCRQFGSDKVVCYCHYCYEGLQIGGADASHLAQLLFAED